MFHIRKMFAFAMILALAVPAFAETPTPTPWPVELILASRSPAPLAGEEATAAPSATPAPFIMAETPAPSASAKPFIAAEETVLPDSGEAVISVTASPVIESAIVDDGLLRVFLKSLGAPAELNLRFPGTYAVEGDPGFRFENGAELTAFVHNGSVWFSAGGLMIDMGESVTLTRHSDEGLYIEESEKNAAYTGDLTLTAKNGVLRPVLKINIEEYLYGVVAYEMSDSFPVEALKAQAVAARTYALEHKFSAGSRDYDVVDTTGDQVYKGYDASYKNVIAAVDATRGVVGTYKGGLAVCYYTASNGGQVSAPNDIWGGTGDDDYITRHADPFDVENPYSLVNSVEFAKDLSDNAQIRKMLEKQLEENCELVSVESIEGTEPLGGDGVMFTKLKFTLNIRREVPAATPEPTETPKTVFGLTLDALLGAAKKPETEWVDGTAEATLNVYTDVKDALNLGLNSQDCEVVSAKETEDGFAIEMRGFGHSVGMSQRGAQWMAGHYDYGWQEILNFYYPNMQLEKIAWPETKIEKLDNLPTIYGYRRPEPTPRPTPKPLPVLEAGEYYAKIALANADSTLNIREQPTTSARILDRFESGWKVIVCSEPDADGWVNIRTAELNGYVKIEYLKAE